MNFFNSYDPTRPGIPNPMQSYNTTNNPLSLAQQISMWSVISVLSTLIIVMSGLYIKNQCRKRCRKFDDSQVIKIHNNSIVSASSYDSEPEYTRLEELKKYIVRQ
ncbi:MAG: hypothetical protein P1U63_12680 [Coxiellaceae bacterium]|nr:hypothetical protein [Coxiellaceae bacterium]